MHIENFFIFIFSKKQFQLLVSYIFKLVQIPTYGESVVNARRRFAGVIRSLADKYPHENLLLITHGKRVHPYIISPFYKR